MVQKRDRFSIFLLKYIKQQMHNCNHNHDYYNCTQVRGQVLFQILKGKLIIGAKESLAMSVSENISKNKWDISGCANPS